MLWCFVFNGLKWEVVVRFVDIPHPLLRSELVSSSSKIYAVLVRILRVIILFLVLLLNLSLYFFFIHCKKKVKTFHQYQQNEQLPSVFYKYSLSVYCPCGCCHAFLWGWRVFLNGHESVPIFYCLFIFVLSLEIQLSGRDGWEPINMFNPVTLLCLSENRTWIYNAICCGVLCLMVLYTFEN
jgi:hypothetical protein